MIIHYFGLPRCGKSTFAAMLAQRELRRIEAGRSKFRRVLSNVFIEGCFKFSFEDFGSFDISDSLILIDEASIDVDNRDWKNFSKEKLSLICLHGHFNADLVFFSQDPKGIDRKIQSCREQLFWIRKFGPWSFAIPLKLRIVINDLDPMPQYGIRSPSLYSILSARWIFRPRWYRYHDSYWRPQLPPMMLDRW